MNEATPLAVRWFKSGKGTVGVVKCQLEDGAIEYRIGAVDGFMEKMDVLQLVAWGAEFPAAAGKALMGK
jgi:hypothetical protein